jgi:hypothetical protein
MARKIVTPELTDLQKEIMNHLKDFSKTNPLSTTALMKLTGELSEDLLPVLNSLADDFVLIDGERVNGDVMWFPLDGSETPAPAAKKTAAKKVAPKPSTPVVKAAEPAPEATQTGLTRQQIAAELPSLSVELPESEDWHNEEFEPTIPEYEGPTSIPNPPAGVNGNTWELAFYANTATGRAFWNNKVQEQLAAYDAAQQSERAANGDVVPF